MTAPRPPAVAGGEAATSPGPVLVVTTSYPRRRDDFAGSFVRRRVEELVAQGHRVEVIAAGTAAGPDRHMSSPGLRVERVEFAVAGQESLFYADGAPEQLERCPAVWLQAARLWGGLLPALQARRPQPLAWVESHWLMPSSLAVAAAGLAGPHRAVAHSGDVALLERLPLGASLARWLLPRLASLAFASADLRARFARLVGPAHDARMAAAEVMLVASGTGLVAGPRPPAAERQRRRQLRGIPGGLVLAVGRLVPIKGHDLLVRAVARLPSAWRPTVVILGEGRERLRLEQLARARGVRLLLPGTASGAEVADWLAMADLFVQPSRPLPSGRTEGAPVALREALAAGVPVLAARTGGIPELLAPAAPPEALFNPGDLPALSLGIATHAAGHVSGTGVLRVQDS